MLKRWFTQSGMLLRLLWARFKYCRQSPRKRGRSRGFLSSRGFDFQGSKFAKLFGALWALQQNALMNSQMNEWINEGMNERTVGWMNGWLNERTVGWERERNVLFNDTLNTFYLRLYGVRYMVKDHSDSEKGNPLPQHRLLLSINSKGSFTYTIPQTG